EQRRSKGTDDEPVGQRDDVHHPHRRGVTGLKVAYQPTPPKAETAPRNGQVVILPEGGAVVNMERPAAVAKGRVEPAVNDGQTAGVGVEAVEAVGAGAA